MLVAPASALACPIPIRTIGPLNIKPGELVRPVHRPVDRAEWGVDDASVSTRPRLSQFILIRKVGRVHGVTYRAQRALSIDAYGPDDHGWMWFEDDDPDTQPCTLVGQVEWQKPVIRVKQTATQIRVIAVTQRTPGDRTGCTYGPDMGTVECPNLARTIVRLAKPVGSRQLSFELL